MYYITSYVYSLHTLQSPFVHAQVLSSFDRILPVVLLDDGYPRSNAMLKWKAPKRNQVRATSKWAATDKQNTSPRLTDDPLAAAINVEALVPHTKGMSRILGGPKRQPEPGQIYSVSR